MISRQFYLGGRSKAKKVDLFAALSATLSHLRESTETAWELMDSVTSWQRANSLVQYCTGSPKKVSQYQIIKKIVLSRVKS